jgi:hypothetical protein
MTDATLEAAKKKVAEDREARQKAQQEHTTKMAGVKPTPTQDENDMAAVGAHVHEKEDDGSGPDPLVEENKKRAEEAQAAQEKRRKDYEAQAKPAAGAAGYQTKQGRARSE